MASLGSGGLGMGITFVLKDKFTQVGKKIRQEQDRLFGSTNKLADGATASMSKITSAKLLAGGIAILAPLTAFVKASAQLSDGLADVQKTTGLTNAELSKFRDTVEGLDTRTSIADLLEIGTVGGRLGVAKEELEGFTAAVDKAVVALGDDFSGGAEQIASNLGTIKTLFKDTKNLKFDDALNQIGSALNELGNKGNNSAPGVADFTKRLGQLGGIAPKLSETLGIGATLQELGLSAEIAAGGVGNLFFMASKNSEKFASQMNISTDALKDMINTDPNKLLIDLASSFSNMDNDAALSALEGMGVGSAEAKKVVLGLSKSVDILKSRQLTAAKAMKDGTSLTSEFNLKNNTLQANIDKLTKRLTILAQRIGDAVAPVFMVLGTIVGIVVEGLLLLAKSPVGNFLLKLITIVALAAVGMAFYNLAIQPVISSLKKMAIQASATIVSLLPFILAALPFIIFITVIKKSVDAFKAFNGVIGTGFTLFLQRVGGLVAGIMEIVTSWDSVTETFLLSKGLAQKLKQLGILDLVIAIGTWVVRLIEFVKGLWSGLKVAFSIFKGVGIFLLGIFKPLGTLLSFIGGLIGKNTTQVKAWLKAGKVVGVVMGFLLTGIAIKLLIIGASLVALAVIWVAQWVMMGLSAALALAIIIIKIAIIGASIVALAVIWIAQWIMMGLAAVVALLPIIIIFAVIAVAVVGIYMLIDWLMGKFNELWGDSTSWLDFGKNMLSNIWEGIKSGWSSFTSWLSGAMASIPVIGKFFEDEESTATVNQQINGAGNTNELGSSIAAQKGLVSSPAQSFIAGAGAQQQGVQQINLLVDGNKMAEVINDKNTLEQARE